MSKEPFVHIDGWMTKLSFPAPKMIIYAIVYALCHNDPDPNPKGAYCSMAYFSKYSMVSKTTVRKYIKELVEEKYFARKVEFIYDGKMQKNYLWANTPEDRGKEIEGFSYEWEAFGDDTERLVKIQESWEKRKLEKEENEEFIEEGGYSRNLRGGGYSSNLRGGTQDFGGGTQDSLGHNNIKITSPPIAKGKYVVSKETSEESLKKLETRKVNKDGKVSKKEQLQRNYEIVCEEFEDEELRQSWWDFLEMRLEQHNKTYTEKGIRLKIKEFKNSISGDIELGRAALDQAVAENWMGWHINESTKLLKNNYRPVAESGSGLYKPKDGEDITYQRMFDLWKKYLGTNLPQTASNVMACKELLADIGEEWLEKLIVALRMRSQTNFVVREIKAIQDFQGLADNRSMMMSFYEEHRKEWELKVREAQTGKKPWEL